MPSLSDALAHLAKRAGSAADEMDRAAASAGRLPKDVPVSPPITEDRDDGRGIAVSDDLPPHLARLFAGFRASGRTTGATPDDAREAIDDARESAEELLGDISDTDRFLETSQFGRALRKVLDGYGFGGIDAGGQASISALDLVERYISVRAELESGKADAQRVFLLKDSLTKLQQFFQRLFGNKLGSITDLARELKKLRDLLGEEGTSATSSSRSSRSSGTLGQSGQRGSSSSASLQFNLQSGLLR